MMNADGKYTCDHEYRVKSGHWAVCNKRATVEVRSKVLPSLFLNYCRRHAPISAKSLEKRELKFLRSLLPEGEKA